MPSLPGPARSRRPAALATLLLAACAAPPKADHLAAAIAAELAAFHGDAGVYVQHLRTGAEVAIRADEAFPTASTIKVPILVALLAKVARGEIAWDTELTYTKERLYPGEDLLGSFADGSKITVAKLAMLMITMSDNTASLWCQELAGTGTAINEWLAGAGFTATRVNSRTPGREAAKKEFGWGQTTPREMARFLVLAHAGTLVDAAVSDEVLRSLGRIWWDDEALSAFPPSVHTASKQGAVDRSRSEVVLVFAPHGAFVLSVFTKNQQDTSWKHDNEGFVLLRRVAALCWRHFEPDSPYEPPPGSERFR